VLRVVAPLRETTEIVAEPCAASVPTSTLMGRRSG